jgi:hypothetical protein
LVLLILPDCGEPRAAGCKRPISPGSKRPPPYKRFDTGTKPSASHCSCSRFMQRLLARSLLARSFQRSTRAPVCTQALVIPRSHSHSTMPSTMQAANRLQTALNEGKTALGCWQMLPGANVARTLARCGVDWVLVDCEHGNIDGESRPPLLVTRASRALARHVFHYLPGTI